MKKPLLSLLSLVLAAVLVASVSFTAAPAFAASVDPDGFGVRATDKLNVVIDGEEYDLLSARGAIGAFVAADGEKELKYVLFTYLERVFKTILGTIIELIPQPDTIVSVDEYVSENFFDGTDEFLDAPADGAKWKLGYAQASLVPDDVLTKNYYLAGYLLQNFPSNTVEAVLDDMKVRVVALDDGSGRGVTVFATVDCIGIANADVKKIRALVTELIDAEKFASINVFATHCHSCIDTQGLWNPFFLKMAYNIASSATGIGEMISGPDEEYMTLLRSRVSDAIVRAVNGMETGTMRYSEKDIPEYYFDDRRPESFLSYLARFRFLPDDGGRPTMLVNMGAHPYLTGLKTDISSGKELSGDYVYYMEEVVNAGGYNFMFINGAILGVYTSRGLADDGVPTTRRSQYAERYGRELGRIVLAMDKTVAEIEADPVLLNAEQLASDRAQGGESFTLWYADWQPVAETEVVPLLNIALAEVPVVVDCEVMQFVGKTGLANNRFIVGENGEYMTVTETGYIEIGTETKIIMMPGELSTDIVTGEAGYTAEQSFSGLEFGYPCLSEVVESDDVLVFGLANDAVGYILPDNDYCMIFLAGSDFFGDHYQETISLGKHVGSTLAQAFIKLYNTKTSD